MKLEKAMRRDRRINKRKYGMRRDGDSVFLIQEVLRKKAEERRKALEKKDSEEAEACLLEGLLFYDE